MHVEVHGLVLALNDHIGMIPAEKEVTWYPNSILTYPDTAARVLPKPGNAQIITKNADGCGSSASCSGENPRIITQHPNISVTVS